MKLLGPADVDRLVSAESTHVTNVVNAESTHVTSVDNAESTRVMNEFFEMVYDFRLLLAKEEKLAIALDDEERVRLIGLEVLLCGDAPGRDPRRRMPRVPAPVGVQFTVAGGFGAGQVLNASGGGFAIATTAPGGLGARTIVRVSLPATGIEYVFPCRVVWTQFDAQSGMGVAFDGVPSRSLLLGRSSRTWRVPIQFGARRKAPIAA